MKYYTVHRCILRHRIEKYTFADSEYETNREIKKQIVFFSPRNIIGDVLLNLRFLEYRHGNFYRGGSSPSQLQIYHSSRFRRVSLIKLWSRICRTETLMVTMRKTAKNGSRWLIGA